MMPKGSRRTSISGKEFLRYPQVKCKRCGRNRRIQPSQGYYYSHTIGWVCRRGLSRRKSDVSD